MSFDFGQPMGTKENVVVSTTLSKPYNTFNGSISVFTHYLIITLNNAEGHQHVHFNVPTANISSCVFVEKKPTPFLKSKVKEHHISSSVILKWSQGSKKFHTAPKLIPLGRNENLRIFSDDVSFLKTLVDVGGTISRLTERDRSHAHSLVTRKFSQSPGLVPLTQVLRASVGASAGPITPASPLAGPTAPALLEDMPTMDIEVEMSDSDNYKIF
eukprot:gnl/Dysnectes_brevis/1079_a1204_2831.p1 GENE.gnl/Dysnectes_brevis/1079_a1204_2831~~gnl/Dysnectes_brevis/1079_a1204_2831.p1  ORF type:complete len:214 (+),score=43.76 gnl/Dysnectes_brevis/1079_a1204_2831:39-680(+)